MFLFNVVVNNFNFPAEKIKELLEINTFKSGKKNNIFNIINQISRFQGYTIVTLTLSLLQRVG